VSYFLFYLSRVDKLFPKPKVEIVLKFSSPVTIASPLEATLNDLHYRLIKDALNETIYTAEMAELNCGISHSDSSLGIRISGFSEKATLLLRTVIDTIYDPDRFITEAIFQRQVEIADRLYQNETLKSSSTAYMSRLIALKPSKYHPKTKLKFLSDKSAINTTAMKAYCLRFLQSLAIDVLVQGNLTSLEAYSLDSVLRGQDKVPICMSVSHLPHQPIVRLPMHPSAVILAVAPDNPKEKNVCVEAYYQLHEYELLGYTRLELLEHLLSEPLFDSLRTKQQVYMVIYIYIYMCVYL